MEVRAVDGRALEVVTGGPQDGEVVLFHSGTPSSAGLMDAWLDAGAERGLRHVTYSRPGYGTSDRRPDRSVADCIPDVEAICGELGIDRFHTVGWSGGGPHALACAALLPERVLAAATIGGVAPRDAGGLDWLEGMGQENLDEFAAAELGPEALEEYLEAQVPALQEADADGLIAALGDLVSEVDRGALTGELGGFYSANLRHAMAQGSAGWFDDDLAFFRDWGFDLGAVEVPVSVWQGRQDRFVPPAHGDWLAANVAGARAELHDDEGHLSLVVTNYGRILDGLVSARR